VDVFVRKFTSRLNPGSVVQRKLYLRDPFFMRGVQTVDFALLNWSFTVRTMRFLIFGFAWFLSVRRLIGSARRLLLALGMMLRMVGRLFTVE